MPVCKAIIVPHLQNYWSWPMNNITVTFLIVLVHKLDLTLFSLWLILRLSHSSLRQWNLAGAVMLFLFFRPGIRGTASGAAVSSAAQPQRRLNEPTDARGRQHHGFYHSVIFKLSENNQMRKFLSRQVGWVIHFLCKVIPCKNEEDIQNGSRETVNLVLPEMFMSWGDSGTLLLKPCF